MSLADLCGTQDEWGRELGGSNLLFFLDFTGSEGRGVPRRAKLDSRADNQPEPRRKWDQRGGNRRKPGREELRTSFHILTLSGQRFICRGRRIVLMLAC